MYSLIPHLLQKILDFWDYVTPPLIAGEFPSFLLGRRNMFNDINMYVLLPNAFAPIKLKLDCNNFLVAVMEELQNEMKGYTYELTDKIVRTPKSRYLLNVSLTIYPQTSTIQHSPAVSNSYIRLNIIFGMPITEDEQTCLTNIYGQKNNDWFNTAHALYLLNDEIKVEEDKFAVRCDTEDLGNNMVLSSIHPSCQVFGVGFQSPPSSIVSLQQLALSQLLKNPV